MLVQHVVLMNFNALGYKALSSTKDDGAGCFSQILQLREGVMTSLFTHTFPSLVIFLVPTMTWLLTVVGLCITNKRELTNNPSKNLAFEPSSYPVNESMTHIPFRHDLTVVPRRSRPHLTVINLFFTIILLQTTTTGISISIPQSARIRKLKHTMGQAMSTTQFFLYGKRHFTA